AGKIGEGPVRLKGAAPLGRAVDVILAPLAGDERPRTDLAPAAAAVVDDPGAGPLVGVVHRAREGDVERVFVRVAIGHGDGAAVAASRGLIDPNGKRRRGAGGQR